jgi:large subunit ribosomal protein L10
VKRERKQQIVEALNKEFKDAKNALLIDYRGINATDATQLRARIREISSNYRVVKNNLALRALEESPLAQLKEHFQGPIAVAYNSEDPIALAKLLVDFSKDKGIFTFKAGVMDGKQIEAEQIKIIASLPSREVLLAKLVLALKMPLIRLAAALGSPIRNLVTILNEIEKKKTS